MKRQRQRFQHFVLILFLISLLNLCVFCVPVQAEVAPLLDSFAEGEFFHDIAGHWAENEINTWMAR